MSAISVQRLTRSWGATTAVRELDVEVERGELYGLVGPDGAGKTTAISCLAGLLHPSSGRVRILGRDPVEGRGVREKLGLMPQEFSLYGDLTIAENLRFFGKLFRLSPNEFRARRDRLLAITRLGPFLGRRASALSGGMYKKLALSAALLHEPEVLLLDEPTNGVDPVSRRELWDLIYELVADGMTVFVSTPYMDEAARCHRVGLMDQGRLIAEGPPRDLVRDLEHPVMEIEGDSRDELHSILEHDDDIIAVSPAGSRLRAILRPGSTERLGSMLGTHGATWREVDASFEDVFIARLVEDHA